MPHARKQQLDFLGIGAQKAGTTALYMQIKDHPKLALPAGKEAPFFNRPVKDAGSFGEFLAARYHNQSPDKRWGKISPQYMSNRETAMRIAEVLPNVRIIACLRNPIDRAISHYNMSVRRGLESRPIDLAFKECCDRDRLDNARNLPGLMEHERHCYVAWGEYGRILGYYFELLPAEHILVIAFDELIKDPPKVLSRTFEFLGVDPAYVPSNQGRRYFESAGGSRLPAVRCALRAIARTPIYKAIPSRWRDGMKLRFRMLDEKPVADHSHAAANASDLSRSTLMQLTDLYTADLERFAGKFRADLGIRMPPVDTGFARAGR